MRTMVIVLTAVFLLFCATSPTGRKTITFLSDNQMNSMGLQAFEQIKQKTEIENNTRINDYVKCVAKEILSVTQDNTGVSSWEVLVFRSSQVNAFALPGGKIGVYTGILQVADEPAQLAAILGHEVGHVIARHSNERASQGMLVSLGNQIVSALANDSPHKKSIMTALGLGTQVGVILPFSRTHENEADVIGLELMARAGFDPQAAVTLWQKMGALSGGNQIPEMLSTHPASSTRVEKLSAALPQALTLFKEAKAAGKNPLCSR